MPHKFNASRRHKFDKVQYRVINWAEYNESLGQRGDLTIWVSEEAQSVWSAPRRTSRGGQWRYSDLAIETCLTLRTTYRLALRQTQGLMGSIGTIMGLEILEAAPDIDVIMVPVGGGSGACGVAIAAKSIKPDVQVIGIQSVHAPVVYESWKARKLLSSDLCETFAEGMATRQAFELSLGILIDRLDDFVLVTDEELYSAIRLLFGHTHNIAEGAGAAAMEPASR